MVLWFPLGYNIISNIMETTALGPPPDFSDLTGTGSEHRHPSGLSSPSLTYGIRNPSDSALCWDGVKQKPAHSPCLSQSWFPRAAASKIPNSFRGLLNHET